MLDPAKGVGESTCAWTCRLWQVLHLRGLFRQAVIFATALIGLGRSAGFSLDEIARMFTADGGPHIDRHLLKVKADQLDRTIRRLGALRDGLRHAAVCPAPSHLECPTFRGLLAGAKASPRRPSGQGRAHVAVEQGTVRATKGAADETTRQK